ncbi:prolyl-tRNA synthetase [Lysobacter maris]|uniref:Prolyl-tRNA synthetase n=1 Tax=Marilutibacter maris TaxID=1605891 RepID=A0A2U9TD94_9GAMM|nr:prolyl-tRNA synthetase [Lysobacter maris]
MARCWTRAPEPCGGRRLERVARHSENAMLSPRLHNLLDTRHMPYTTHVHERTVTAHDTAAATHVSRELFAKTVMIKVDGRLAMLVMPAAYRVDLTRLSRALGEAEVELAEESEFRDAFPDCELGAMPPFGHLYDMPVYVDSRLARQKEITFNAGTHIEAVTMPYKAFEKLAEPEMLWLAYVM